jgi:DNA replication and repair protein RecF
LGYFQNINFNNYRNFSKSSFNFDKGCNIILGNNGSGKTNILEGISLFDKGRGFRKEKIYNLINYNNLDIGFEINSFFKNENTDFNIDVFNSENNSKKISINNSIEVESVKHFQSLFSIIYFLPEMERLFVSNPSSRRNFLDRLIFTFNKKYSSIINSYKKAVNERNILLKNITYDENWIKIVEDNIVKFGSIIYKSRENQVQNINTILNTLNVATNFSYNFFLKINDKFLDKNSPAYENPELYSSIIKNNRKIDFISRGCTIGPHLSDLSGYSRATKFNVNQLSTGQQKTVILLIILAQCKYLIDKLEFKPIILLDEVCSHLDYVNRELLLYLIEELNVQVFLTGTEKSFFSFLSTKGHYCNIS